ncbi:hypothetical protein CDD82_230 [Ophiocordyceps australis]|uniref:DNA mismatch repair protein S5 domain-containing protein n=1 Tax=Ophiocordyceps australis TaxID=1399860 RepID=A0A2C5YPL5_9HYPO|nr:hypothetical protein CDD82_230 [Ophiocordyceps australis]
MDDAQPWAGSKRKAPDEADAPPPARRIRALDPDVVNKIAAGEIIVAPVHALKELIENAVDAASTSLDILVKDGGLKLLQITDDGCGIQKQDLSILCERHTTSKITAFDDLSSIGTYGFRGEALASISHVAHLTVTTRCRHDSSPMAWRAHYVDGKLAPPKPGQPAEPKAVAGRFGTQITVQDLFYNVPIRRRAFRSYADEFNKIVDMVGRYAIHCAAVAFTCKKAGEPSDSLSIQARATTVDKIRQIHGSSVAHELIDFCTTSHRWGFKARGLVTNANYHVKKTTLLLFINHRSVESSAIKKAIEHVYANYLPKGGRPFVYLSLEIDAARVDVNVHPTKKEVHFLNQDEIIGHVCAEIEQQLAAVDTSRTFETQTLLPGARIPHNVSPDDMPCQSKSVGKRRRNSNDLVRTDSSMRKITSMFAPADTRQHSDAVGPVASEEPLEATPDSMEYEMTRRELVTCRLRSVKELRSQVREQEHNDFTQVMASHTFVGIVDERRRLAAIQGGVKLYLVDYGQLCFDYFYQLGLTDFGNLGLIRFSPPLGLRQLLTIAAETEKSALGAEAEADDGFNTEAIVDKVMQQLVERREMLLEYFSLEISPTAEVVSIPLMIKGYTPPLAKLPRFLLRLGPGVDWTEEKTCFDSFLRELASFYVPEQLPPAPADGSAEQDMPAELQARRQHVCWALEHVLFPAFKAGLVATKSLANGAVLEAANLKGLYRVFERC